MTLWLGGFDNAKGLPKCDLQVYQIKLCRSGVGRDKGDRLGCLGECSVVEKCAAYRFSP